MPPYTTSEFIQKSRERHGDKYEYDRCVYVGSRLKVTVTCPSHGDFEVAGANHLSGTGCAKCVQADSKRNQTYTTETYIEKCIAKFGELYDYSETVYVFSKDKVRIICPEHGIFEMAANNHLSGRGCPTCGRRKFAKNRIGIKLDSPLEDTQDFISRSIAIHGHEYNYEESEYINSSTKVKISCLTHGSFFMLPRTHIDRKTPKGCPICGTIKSAVKRSKGIEAFIKESTEVHGGRYDYSKTQYVSVDQNVIIVCRAHGEFEQTPYHHIKHRAGCPTCGKTLAYTTESFIKKALSVHSEESFDYSKVNYKTAHDKIIITCPKHGDFQQTAFQHLRGNGCAQCWTSNGASKMQIEWLELKSFQLRRQIQHALNLGEYKIPGSRYSADGFDAETNTIFEFHGRFFHSDPRVHPASEWNHLLKISHGDNYKKTIARENFIKGAGYNLVVMWETDWRIFIRHVRRIQRAFRKIRYDVSRQLR